MTDIDQVLDEVGRCVHLVSSESLAQAVMLMERAPRIFVAGAGRSGLCMQALAMRLMHLGKPTFVVGETTTPSITDGDLLILGSGSGKTASLLPNAEQARRHGAAILLFTADETAPLAALANFCLLIPAPLAADREKKGANQSVQPLGTLFEQSLLLLGDSLVLGLMERMDVDESQMALRHANLQ